MPRGKEHKPAKLAIPRITFHADKTRGAHCGVRKRDELIKAAKLKGHAPLYAYTEIIPNPEVQR